MATAIKEKRIEFRVSNETKKLLEERAKSSNLSLSSYIVMTCLRNVNKIDKPIDQLNDLYNKLDNVVKYNEPLSINTKSGEAVVISKSDYDAFIETFYLMSEPKIMEKIKAGELEEINKMKTYNPNEAW